jgi:hypothetical protein
MLHITNGDSVVETLRRTALGGDIVAWRDVLHEGPVPRRLSLTELSRVRAGFIAAQGWALEAEAQRQFAGRDQTLMAANAQDEVVLWFEHDLYDQLQLLQVLDWFAGQFLGTARLSLICAAEYLGPLDVPDLTARFPDRRDISKEQLLLARAAWEAFRSPDPRELLPFLGERSAALPFLAAAIRRHLQQFPDLRRGLSRSEAQALTAIAAGHFRVRDAYVESHQRMEDAVFLGDTVFVSYLQAMTRERSPLVAMPGSAGIAATSADFWNSELGLTNAGRAVLEGQEDRIVVNGIDRWLGGVHLQAGDVWRWNDAKATLVRSE